MISVDEIMSAHLFTLRAADSVYDARALMKEKNIRHIPVVGNDGSLAGIVTERDLLAASESTLYATSNDQRIALEKEHLIAEIMTEDVHTINASDSLKSAALHMRKFKHGCLPVVRDNELVGIVTDTDFVAVAVTLIEQLEESNSFTAGDEFDEVDDYADDLVDDLESL